MIYLSPKTGVQIPTTYFKFATDQPSTYFIPIYVEPFPVDDSVPTEDDIEWAVKHLRNNRYGGTSGMQAEHLKRWLETARKAAKE